ncbi:MAG: PAS domain-containing protein [Nitrospirae bacterium]|jgi:PAS domain-containing protein|nr:PAS domain-containing protein [Nitrospirota bacterium]
MERNILTPEEIGALLDWSPAARETEAEDRDLQAGRLSPEGESPSGFATGSSPSTDFFRDMLDALGEAMIITDFSGKILFENAVSRDLLDKPLSAIRKKTFGVAVPLFDKHRNRQSTDPVQKVLREKQPFRFPQGTVLLRPDGSTVPVDGTATPFFHPDGQAEGVVVSFRRKIRPSAKRAALPSSPERQAR